MSKSQRTKGASYEREVGHAFSAALGLTFPRNIGQSRDGGNDLDVGPLLVECKRRKTLTVVESWLRQAQAALVGRAMDLFDYKKYFGIVVGRSDNGQSLVVLPLADFLELAGPELRRRIDEHRTVVGIGA